MSDFESWPDSNADWQKMSRNTRWTMIHICVCVCVCIKINCSVEKNRINARMSKKYKIIIKLIKTYGYIKLIYQFPICLRIEN